MEPRHVLEEAHRLLLFDHEHDQERVRTKFLAAGRVGRVFIFPRAVHVVAVNQDEFSLHGAKQVGQFLLEYLVFPFDAP